MRILQLAPPWFAVPPTGYGGIEWVVSALADGLTARGHEVTLLASGGSRTSADLAVVFEEPPSELLGDATTETVHALAGYLRRADFDLIHDHSGVVGLAIAVVTSPTPPVVHTLHGPWTESRRRLYPLVAPPVHLVAISGDQRRRAPDEVPIAGVVHNGVDLTAHPFTAAKEDRLAFVGRASPEKGPEVAIEVAQRTGLPLTMCIKVNEADERRYYEDVLDPLIRRFDVEVIRDPTPEVKAAVMGRSRAVLCALQWPEPFGLVMAEAQACGTPVVAYAEGAAPEIIDHGRTGFLVAPGDLDGFIRAVEKAGELSPYDCRNRAESHFSSEKMVAGYEAVYETVVGGEDVP